MTIVASAASSSRDVLRESLADAENTIAAEQTVAKALIASGWSPSPPPSTDESGTLTRQHDFFAVIARFLGRTFCCETVDEVLSRSLPSLPRIDVLLAEHFEPPTVISPQREVLIALEECMEAGEGDLDLRRMVTAFEQMLHALETLGAWTFLAKREVRANLAKLEQSAAVQAERIPQLLNVLRAEKALRLHKPGALADPSAALALTWLLRFLSMWCDVWLEPRPPTFREALMLAYGTHIKPYHSWLVKRTFSIAVAVVPSWAAARERLNEFDAGGEAGLLQNIAALRRVLGRIETALEAEGLSDNNKV